MGVYEIENLINLTLPRQRNLQFLKTAFILDGVQPGEAHVYPIFFIMHGFNTKEKSTIGKNLMEITIYIFLFNMTWQTPQIVNVQAGYSSAIPSRVFLMDFL